MAARPEILRKTKWFGKKEKFEIDFFDLLQPKRTVSSEERYRNGIFYSQKCNRNIQHESGLELDFIERCLENNPEVVFYWEQPVSVPYYRGKIRDRWTPDFGVYMKSGHFVIVEIKSLAEMIDHRVQAKIEGLMDFCSRRGFGLLLTDGTHTPADLLRGKVNRRLEKELLIALEDGPIRKYQWGDIKYKSNASESQLHRSIIRLDLKFKPFPFKLQRGKQSPVFRQVYFAHKKYDEIIDEQLLSSFRSQFDFQARALQ